MGSFFHYRMHGSIDSLIILKLPLVVFLRVFLHDYSGSFPAWPNSQDTDLTTLEEEIICLVLGLHFEESMLIHSSQHAAHQDNMPYVIHEMDNKEITYHKLQKFWLSITSLAVCTLMDRKPCGGSSTKWGSDNFHVLNEWADSCWLWPSHHACLQRRIFAQVSALFEATAKLSLVSGLLVWQLWRTLNKTAQVMSNF